MWVVGIGYACVHNNTVRNPITLTLLLLPPPPLHTQGKTRFNNLLVKIWRCEMSVGGRQWKLFSLLWFHSALHAFFFFLLFYKPPLLPVLLPADFYQISCCLISNLSPPVSLSSVPLLRLLRCYWCKWTVRIQVVMMMIKFLFEMLFILSEPSCSK